jgi:predicted GNAT family N-acyltransferase
MGITTRTLELLIQDAKQHGITSVSLEATDIGRKLYESYGFVSMASEMEFLII